MMPAAAFPVNADVLAPAVLDAGTASGAEVASTLVEATRAPPLDVIVIVVS